MKPGQKLMLLVAIIWMVAILFGCQEENIQPVPVVTTQANARVIENNSCDPDEFARLLYDRANAIESIIILQKRGRNQEAFQYYQVLIRLDMKIRICGSPKN